MAFSWQESVKPAGTQDIQCDIEYLDKSYIHVYLDGAETTAFTWTSSTNIRLNSPLSAETAVLLIRKTAREYLYIEFASGAPFIEGNVDTQNTQFLHLAQELVEGRSIEGFYGDINMHRYRITNLGDPVDARDAANKQYVDVGDARLDARVDAEAAARMAADDALDGRVVNLEQTYFNANTNSFPWWTLTTTPTNTITPGMPFTKAKVRLNGITQTAGYSYSVSNGVITFAETIPAGTLVDVTVGIDTTVDTSAVSTVMGLLASSKGASYIGGLGYTTPEMFGYVPGITPDAVPYIQAAIDLARSNKVPVKLTGTYYTASTPVYVPLPGDDGTAYPGWVTGGGDENLTAEPENNLMAALRIYGDTTIIGAGSAQCKIVGPWDADNPVADNYQPVCFYIQGQAPIDGYVRYKLSGVTIQGYFVGRYCANILNHSCEDDLIVQDCGFPGIFLGADAVQNGFVTARGCYAAEVYGGWWTHRNAAITIPYLPPYPAEEIFKVGWVDSLNYAKYAFYGRQRTFGDIDNAFDTWFDTYIYKSANSATVSSGGRRTNNTASGFSSRSFRGVANRAFAVFSRYGRQVNSVIIGEFKSLCTSRVPVYADPGNKNAILQAYVERAGLVNTAVSSVSGNEFYLDYPDPRDSAYTQPPSMVGQGSIVVDRVVVSAGVGTNQFSEAVNELSGPRRIRTFRRNADNYSMLELSEWNSSLGQVLYRYSFDKESSVQRPISFFSAGQELFQYLAGTWTPVVSCGSETVAGEIATGTYRRVGKLVHVTFRFEANSMSLVSGGAVVISGLPFTVAALSAGGMSLAPVVCSRAGSAVILAQTTPGSKSIALLSSSSPSAFSVTGGTGLTIYGALQYVLVE